MASTNQTPNYKLNQWTAEDPVLRTDFNLDNSKIDQALKNLSPVTGVYTGTGDGETQTVRLGFKPRILLVFPMGGLTLDNWQLIVGLSIEGYPCKFVTLTDTGFTVGGTLNFAPDEQSNYYKERNPYRYLAWR